MRTRALALAVFLSVPACILFVNDDPGAVGPTCSFGDKTDAGACGACLAKNCQKEINACCVSSSCRDRGMAALDACAKGEAAQCVSTDLGHDLETCVATGCGNECLGGITSCTSGTNECSCRIDTFSPNTVKCIEATVHNSICCADMSWPSSTSTCRCTYWGCTFSGQRCDCSVRSFAGSPSDYQDGCTFATGHCCRSSTGACACSTSVCSSFDVEVPDCKVANAGCGTYARRVTACAQ